MTLSRQIHPMPDKIKTQLHESGLQDAYDARPPYQQNDYLGWIARAKRKETRLKRIDQMLAELKMGDTYMKMAWNKKPSA